jgi:hypothetical protein
LAAQELFQFGDAELVLRGSAVLLEEARQAVEDSGLPVGEELRLEVVFAAQIRLAGGAGQQFQDELRFEL